MTKSIKQINKEAGMDDVDSSPAVIAYRVAQLEEAVRLGFKDHNEKLDKLVESFATKADTNALDKRLSALESNQTWVVRLVITQVVLAVSALIGGAVVLNR